MQRSHGGIPRRKGHARSPISEASSISLSLSRLASMSITMKQAGLEMARKGARLGSVIEPVTSRTSSHPDIHWTVMDWSRGPSNASSRVESSMTPNRLSSVLHDLQVGPEEGSVIKCHPAHLVFRYSQPLRPLLPFTLVSSLPPFLSSLRLPMYCCPPTVTFFLHGAKAGKCPPGCIHLMPAARTENVSRSNGSMINTA